MRDHDTADRALIAEVAQALKAESIRDLGYGGTLVALVPEWLVQLSTALARRIAEGARLREFVTLANTVWTRDRAGRAAKRLADQRMSEIVACLVAEEPPR